MPKPERGEFEDPKKSAYSIEYYDSGWELEYMKEMIRGTLLDLPVWTPLGPYCQRDGRLLRLTRPEGASS